MLKDVTKIRATFFAPLPLYVLTFAEFCYYSSRRQGHSSTLLWLPYTSLEELKYSAVSAQLTVAATAAADGYHISHVSAQ